MKFKPVLVVLFLLGVAAANLLAAVKDGDLVQGSGAAVYIIRDGKRVGIKSAKQFEEMGLKWENVIKITDADLNAIPLFEEAPVPIRPYPSAKNGDVIQGSAAAVFLVRDGKRHGIKSVRQFEDLGLKWENVIKISDADLNAVPLGEVLPDVIKPYPYPKNGDLVQGTGVGVYLIRDGKRCAIKSTKQFEEMGLKWENVIKISDADLDAIPEVPL